MAGVEPRSEFATESPNEPSWPETGGRDVVFLLDTASRFERGLLETWIERQRPEAGTAPTANVKVDVLTLPSSRRRRGRLDPGLEPILASGTDPLLAPLRIAWLAPERDGRREARLSDVLALADPRDPDRLRERYLYWRSPERCDPVL